MAMSHEFERHIKFAMGARNERGVAALNALKTQYEIFALAGIVPVLPKEQISRSGQLLDVNPNNPSTITSQPEPQEFTHVFERIVEAFKSGYQYMDNANTTEKLTRLIPGLTKENLYYWERKDFIHPEKVERGTRAGRIYPTLEVLRVVYILKYTRYNHWALQAAAGMAEQELLKIKESQLRHDV